MNGPILNEIIYDTEMHVRYMQHMGSDAMVAAAAKVSVSPEESQELATAENTEGIAGLIGYLVKKRHSCFDEQTEVLTFDGWKYWKDITNNENFITLNTKTNKIEYQISERIIKDEFNGHLISIQSKHIDAIVTPNHRFWAKRSHPFYEADYEFTEAGSFFMNSYRIPLTGGLWETNKTMRWYEAQFIGFFIGDGHLNSQTGKIEFNIRKKRKIKYLRELLFNLEYKYSEHSDKRIVVWNNSFIEEFISNCYIWNTNVKEKCIPREILQTYDKKTLENILIGMINADGSKEKDRTKTVYSTSSITLLNQLQELCLKIEKTTQINKSFHNNYTCCIFQKRNTEPRIGWTLEARKKEVVKIPYFGYVYCATVPNGTLYVRRNGKAYWSGNSPFEHNALTIFGEVPFFVIREWMRHRTQSYNEWSARYSMLEPHFHIPRAERLIVPVEEFKPARPQFEIGNIAQRYSLETSLKHVAEVSWEEYSFLVRDVGIATEVARAVLPLHTYTKFWATANLLNWLRFISLRTYREDATNPSYAQFEIDEAATLVENIIAEHWPVVYEKFNKNGRII